MFTQTCTEWNLFGGSILKDNDMPLLTFFQLQNKIIGLKKSRNIQILLGEYS